MRENGINIFYHLTIDTQIETLRKMTESAIGVTKKSMYSARFVRLANDAAHVSLMNGLSKNDKDQIHI